MKFNQRWGKLPKGRRMYATTTQQAILWARRSYRNCWRKRWLTTLEEHMTTRPKWASARLWHHYYRHPFGDFSFNAYVGALRRAWVSGEI